MDDKIQVFVGVGLDDKLVSIVLIALEKPVLHICGLDPACIMLFSLANVGKLV